MDYRPGGRFADWQAPRPRLTCPGTSQAPARDSPHDRPPPPRRVLVWSRMRDATPARPRVHSPCALRWLELGCVVSCPPETCRCCARCAWRTATARPRCPGAAASTRATRRPRKPRRDALWLTAWGEGLPESFVQNDDMITLYTHAKDHPPLAELNHYSLRSRDEFMVKRHRGLPNHMKKPIDVGYWVERNWNTVEEPRIASMLPATRAMMEDLMALPDVRTRHEATVAAHQRRLNEILQDVEETRLHWQLGLTPNSTPPSPEALRSYLRAMAAARGNKG